MVDVTPHWTPVPEEAPTLETQLRSVAQDTGDVLGDYAAYAGGYVAHQADGFLPNQLDKDPIQRTQAFVDLTGQDLDVGNMVQEGIQDYLGSIQLNGSNLGAIFDPLMSLTNTQRDLSDLDQLKLVDVTPHWTPVPEEAPTLETQLRSVAQDTGDVLGDYAAYAGGYAAHQIDRLGNTPPVQAIQTARYAGSGYVEDVHGQVQTGIGSAAIGLANSPIVGLLPENIQQGISTGMSYYDRATTTGFLPNQLGKDPIQRAQAFVDLAGQDLDVGNMVQEGIQDYLGSIQLNEEGANLGAIFDPLMSLTSTQRDLSDLDQLKAEGQDISDLLSSISPALYGGGKRQALKGAGLKGLGEYNDLVSAMEQVQNELDLINNPDAHTGFGSKKAKKNAPENLKKGVEKFRASLIKIQEDAQLFEALDMLGVDKSEIQEMTGFTEEELNSLTDKALDIVNTAVSDRGDVLEEFISFVKTEYQSLVDAIANAKLHLDTSMLSEDGTPATQEELDTLRARNDIERKAIGAAATALAGDEDDIERMIQNLTTDDFKGFLELAETFTENDIPIPKNVVEILDSPEGKSIAQDIMTGKAADKKEVDTLIGKGTTNLIMNSPMAMAGITAGGLGGMHLIGNMLGGQDSMMGMLPMLMPLLMRLGLGDEGYGTGMDSINQALNAIWEPLIWDNLPENFEKNLEGIPFLPGMIQGMKDNPIYMTGSVIGAATGNDALMDMTMGMFMTDILLPRGPRPNSQPKDVEHVIPTEGTTSSAQGADTGSEPRPSLEVLAENAQVSGNDSGVNNVLFQ